MKFIPFTTIVVLIAAFVLTAGCGRSLQDRIEQAKQNAEGEQRGNQRTNPNAESDYTDEWQAFQTEAERQIASNAKSLDEIELGLSKSDATVRATVAAQVGALTKKNGELKEQLHGYRDQGRLTWNAFKRDFSHDLDGLSKAVNILTTDHK